jgi:hypothetical protein
MLGVVVVEDEDRRVVRNGVGMPVQPSGARS